MINEWHFSATKLGKSANYDSDFFFLKKKEEKKMKIMLVMTNYAKNYASTVDKGLDTGKDMSYFGMDGFITL